jgi:hypothetical protein
LFSPAAKPTVAGAMNTYLTYSFAMAFGGALIVFALFFLGLHDSPAKLDTAQ